MRMLTALILTAALGGIAQAAPLNGNYAFTGMDVCTWNGLFTGISTGTVTGTATFNGTTATLNENPISALFIVGGGNSWTNIGTQQVMLNIAPAGSGFSGTEVAGGDTGGFSAGFWTGLTYLVAGASPWTIVPSGSSGRNQDVIMFSAPSATETWTFSDTSQWNVMCSRTRTLTKVTGDDTN